MLNCAVTEMGQVQSSRGLGMDRSHEVKKSMRSKHIFLTEWMWARREKEK